MLFNSLPFLFVFFPVSLFGFQIAGHFGRRTVLSWLVLVSLFFYAAWNRKFVILLVGSVLINFALSRLIVRSAPGSAARTRYLYSGVALNLLAIFYFKYLFQLLGFLSETSFGQREGFEGSYSILLPLGISFFTFTQIAYLIDLAQGQANEEGFLGYFVFVTFFPHLIAGPLLHHREMMPQFQDCLDATHAPERRFQLRSQDMSVGLSLFIFGLAKKVLIADKLAPAADSAFAFAAPNGLWNLWSGLLIYCMQLYFDFSGYSDMAIGIARCFGIRFPSNFDSPWKSTSVTEYWQRWHMTLTRYITLYLYNPMLIAIQRYRVKSGKKVSRKVLQTPEGFASMALLPLMATMLLTGFWHGAGVKFLVFGGLHGLYLSAHQAWKHFAASRRASESTSQAGPIGLVLMRTGVLLQVSIALVFFRADSIGGAWHYLNGLIGRSGLGPLSNPASLITAILLLAAAWVLPNTQEILHEQPYRAKDAGTFTRLDWKPNAVWAAVLGLLFFACLACLDGASSFLYFQF